MGPLLFNIDLCDLSVIMDQHDIANYVDDNTPYVSGKNIDEVVKSLEKTSRLTFKWFSDNQFQGNISKCHVLLSTDQQVHVNLTTAQIKNSQYEKLLGVTIDTELIFKTHIQQICGKENARLKVLGVIVPFMNLEKKFLMNPIFNTQLSYCPLTWMFQSRKLNNKINRMHVKCLRIIPFQCITEIYRFLQLSCIK